MVGFTGRFAPKQYMPSKPAQYGIKAFTLADSATRYVMNILVYTGADTLQGAKKAYFNLPQPARILMVPYLGKGHTVVTNRYYTSLPLALTLKANRTSFTGTVMKSRIDLPDEIRSPSLRLGNDEILAFRHHDLLALSWRAAQKRSLFSC